MNDRKAKQSAKKDRYLRDQLPIRLGNLASNLSRLESFAGNATLGEAACRVLIESKFFIEWTAADASLSQQVELLELQRTLARWQLTWSKIWDDSEKRSSIAAQAGNWSKKVLKQSGLLDDVNG